MHCLIFASSGKGSTSPFLSEFMYLLTSNFKRASSCSIESAPSPVVVGVGHGLAQEHVLVELLQIQHDFRLHFYEYLQLLLLMMIALAVTHEGRQWHQCLREQTQQMIAMSDQYPNCQCHLAVVVAAVLDEQ
jgi:hypothetical protein